MEKSAFSASAARRRHTPPAACCQLAPPLRGSAGRNRLRRLLRQPPAAVAGSRLRRLPKIIYLLKPKNQKISIFTQIGSFHRNQRKHLMVYPQSRSFFRFFDFFDFFGHFGGPAGQRASGPCWLRPALEPKNALHSSFFCLNDM